jgi:hypothetical protein
VGVGGIRVSVDTSVGIVGEILTTVWVGGITFVGLEAGTAGDVQDTRIKTKMDTIVFFIVISRSRSCDDLF